jgi:hypothetical protein
MASTIGIQINKTMSKIDDKYGDFVSLVKIVIQGPQET